MSASSVLVTGGAGFIGSHTAKLLRGRLSSPSSTTICRPGNALPVRWGPLVHGDILDTAPWSRRSRQHSPERSSISLPRPMSGESVEDPAKYYRNNVGGHAVAA